MADRSSPGAAAAAAADAVEAIERYVTAKFGGPAFRVARLAIEVEPLDPESAPRPAVDVEIVFGPRREIVRRDS